MNSIIFATLFILVLLGSLFLGHFFIYNFLVKFFQITSINTKTYISIVLFILAISFILSSILIHYFDNFYSRNYYFLSWLWLWFLLNINILILILSLLSFIFSKSLLFDNKMFIWGLLIFLSLIISGFWVYNAFSPYVHKVTVKLKNLPSNWNWKKIVMISDVHLWHIYQDSFMQNAVNKINSLNPEAIFIVWDLFDWMDWDLEKYVKPIDNLNAKKWIFFVTGNHETYLWVDKTFKILKSTKLRILNDESVNLDGINLIGFSYPEQWKFKDVKWTLSKLNLDSKIPKILLYHSPTHLSEAEDAWVDLQLSGHAHRWQLFPFNIVTSLVYSWHDYWLTNIWDFQIFTSAWLGTWWPAMRTDSRSEIVEITLNHYRSVKNPLF